MNEPKTRPPPDESIPDEPTPNEPSGGEPPPVPRALDYRDLPDPHPVEPEEDGGNPLHPLHDSDNEDSGPDDYESQIDALADEDRAAEPIEDEDGDAGRAARRPGGGGGRTGRIR